MSVRARLRFVLLWAASLVFVGVWASAQQVPPAAQPPQEVVPSVLSGPNIGFRLEGRSGSTPVVRIVIRKDANSPWIAADLASAPTGRVLR